MYAQKKILTVPASGRVGIDLPSDLVGGEAEVIVLVVPRTPAHPRPGSRDALEPHVSPEELPRGHWKRVQAFLDESYKVDRPRMTKEEVDAYLAEERASWGDEP